MRYMLHGDLHLGQSVRVFAQFKSAIVVDKSFVTGADRDDLDVNQLFVEIHSQLGEGGPRSLCGPADKSLPMAMAVC